MGFTVRADLGIEVPDLIHATRGATKLAPCTSPLDAIFAGENGHSLSKALERGFGVAPATSKLPYTKCGADVNRFFSRKLSERNAALGVDPSFLLRRLVGRLRVACKHVVVQLLR